MNLKNIRLFLFGHDEESKVDFWHHRNKKGKEGKKRSFNEIYTSFQSLVEQTGSLIPSLPIRTLLIIISFGMFTKCASSEEEYTEVAIERVAEQRFRELKDTLYKQTRAECDSTFQTLVQAKVDSLIFEHLKNTDTTGFINASDE